MIDAGHTVGNQQCKKTPLELLRLLSNELRALSLQPRDAHQLYTDTVPGQ
jgi:hypothetical protein